MCNKGGIKVLIIVALMIVCLSILITILLQAIGCPEGLIVFICFILGAVAGSIGMSIDDNLFF